MPLSGTQNLTHTHTQNPSTVGICLNGLSKDSLLHSVYSCVCQIQQALDVEERPNVFAQSRQSGAGTFTMVVCTTGDIPVP